jgi:hypothetical protein
MKGWGNKMVKTVLNLLLIIVLTASSSLAQGYKNFKWGDRKDSVEKHIKNPCSSFIGNAGGFLSAYMHKYAEIADYDVPSPFTALDGESDVLCSDDDKIVFYFKDNKLIVVEVVISYGNSVLETLVEKYGKSKSNSISISNNVYETKAWFHDNGRVIAWQKLKDYPIEYVTYIDKNVFNNAASKINKKIISERSKEKSKID